MKAVIQRVKRASVTVGGEIISEIGPGVLTLLGVEKGDGEAQVEKLMSKILNLRIFEDDEGKLNLSVLDKKWSHLIVSQFTLAGDCSRGRRPSFHLAAGPEEANGLYQLALVKSKALGATTFGGQFQANMEVDLVNNGPVTFTLEA